MKKGVKMMDMSIHDVSGVVGWCLGAYSEVENKHWIRYQFSWCLGYGNGSAVYQGGDLTRVIITS